MSKSCTMANPFTHSCGEPRRAWSGLIHLSTLTISSIAVSWSHLPSKACLPPVSTKAAMRAPGRSGVQGTSTRSSLYLPGLFLAAQTVFPKYCFNHLWLPCLTQEMDRRCSLPLYSWIVDGVRGQRSTPGRRADQGWLLAPPSCVTLGK